jgi:hypothetical protein
MRRTEADMDVLDYNSRKADMGWYFSMRVGRELTSIHRKKPAAILRRVTQGLERGGVL